MGFDLVPLPGDRGEPDVKKGRVGGGALGEERRLVRDGLQVLTRGILVCPDCALPISPAPRLALRAELRCGFCSHAAPAIEFVLAERLDTAGNDVVVVARVGEGFAPRT